MFPSHFTKDSKRRKTHYEELLDLTKTRNIYVDGTFNKFLEENKIKDEYNVPYVHEQNGFTSVIIKLLWR